MNDKQHAEVMDALHTIGRNIAQQEALHSLIARGIYSLNTTLSIAGFVIVLLLCISMVPR